MLVTTTGERSEMGHQIIRAVNWNLEKRKWYPSEKLSLTGLTDYRGNQNTQRTRNDLNLVKNRALVEKDRVKNKLRGEVRLRRFTLFLGTRKEGRAKAREGIRYSQRMTEF